MKGACFLGAELEGADLSEADLQGANFAHANLHGASLTYANLHDADLRGAYRFRLDGNFTRNVRLPYRSTDPWSVLRRTYTGPRMLFNMLFLVAFAIPYIGKVVFWLSINRAQSYS